MAGRGGWAWPVAAVAGLVGVALGVTALGGDPDPGAPRTTASSAADGSSDAGIVRKLPVAGVFGETDPARVAGFARDLSVDVTYAVDFSSRRTWQEIERPTYLLDAWRDTPYRPVLGIAMLPDEGPETMAQGAAGAYDARFAELGRSLVASGHADAVLRIGWEFNLPGSRWSTDDPAEFVAYWRRIAATLRATPGQRFVLDWNVNNGLGAGPDPVPYYPGDDVVDEIGVDAYDVAGGPSTYPYPAGCDATCRTHRQERAWQEQVFGGQRGLRFWTLFAARHGKPVSVPEWGLWQGADADGGGDNPVFVRRMHAYLSNPRNNVAYHAYFDNDSGGRRHRLANFPSAAAEFTRLFGGTAAG